MHISWKNGFFVVGREIMLGHDVFAITLAWNDREALQSTCVELGSFRYADFVQLSWRWPRFGGLRLDRRHMDWKSV